VGGLRSFLDRVTTPQALSGLSLMHTANGEDLLSILESKTIQPAECRVFDGERLVYFFLGRPAYKTSLVHDASYWQLPAVFAFDTLSHHPPIRMYPFDTGAFSLDRYREIIGRIDRAEFALGDSWQTAENLIAYYFGD
jgi:hypothetical protein